MSEVKDRYRGSKEYLLVYCELIRAARYGGVTTYQAVAEIMGLPLSGAYMGREVGRILGEISTDEVQQGRVMLSALVVGTGGRPGPGFFALARGLGRLEGESSEAEEQFWQEEGAVVYEVWKREFQASS